MSNIKTHSFSIRVRSEKSVISADRCSRLVTSLDHGRGSSTDRYQIHSSLASDRIQKSSFLNTIRQRKPETWRVCWETVISGVYRYPRHTPFLKKTAPEKSPTRGVYYRTIGSMPGMAKLLISTGTRTSFSEDDWSDMVTSALVLIS